MRYLEKTFTVKQGLKKAEEQRRFYASRIKDPKKRKKFNEAVKKMIDKAKPGATSGLDIPRGLDIERLYWIIGLGKTEEQHIEYCRSMD